MTAPQELIDNLDAALADAGELVTMRRYTAPTGSPRPKTDIDNVPASIRPVQSQGLVGDLQQILSHVVVSPTLIAAMLPIVKGDKVVIQGKERNVETPKPIFVQGALVRLDLIVSG